MYVKCEDECGNESFEAEAHITLSCIFTAYYKDGDEDIYFSINKELVKFVANS